MHNEELARQVAYWTAQGWQVASTTETTAVLHKPRPKVNHVLHLILSLVTFFLWTPIWLVMALVHKGGVETKTVTAPLPATGVPAAPPAFYAPSTFGELTASQPGQPTDAPAYRESTGDS